MALKLFCYFTINQCSPILLLTYIFSFFIYKKNLYIVKPKRGRFLLKFCIRMNEDKIQG